MITSETWNESMNSFVLSSNHISSVAALAAASQYILTGAALRTRIAEHTVRLHGMRVPAVSNLLAT